jgi:hypothetical protein
MAQRVLISTNHSRILVTVRNTGLPTISSVFLERLRWGTPPRKPRCLGPKS